MARACVASALAVALLLLGCSDDDDGEEQEATKSDAAVLADRLGCDRTAAGGRKGWDVERPVECYVDDGWAATIHAPLDGGGRTSALSLLSSRYGEGGDGLVPCPDGTHHDDVSVIAGETWIVVVTSEAGADRVLDRLGGEVQPGEGTGPPVSYLALPCP